MHAVRSAARPKLSLVVPAVSASASASSSAAAPLSPLTIARRSTFPVAAAAAPPPTTPLTPTARNTQLNARGFTASALAATSGVGVPKKQRHQKRVSFSDVESVTLIAPLPQECYGEYQSMSREERRWARRS